MTFTEMKIKGAWVHTPTIWPDERGTFHEVFKLSQIEQHLGRTFTVKQVNQSVSAKGVIRGIHYTDSPEGQAKYVSCPKGSVIDFVIDMRPESKTYLEWDFEVLTSANANAILLGEGLGHAFLSLEQDTVVNYLCTAEYLPEFDKVVSVYSSRINLPLIEFAAKYKIDKLILSDRDAQLEGEVFK